MSKRIADLMPEQLQRGIWNLDASIAEADDAVREAAGRLADLVRDRSTLQALLEIKSREMSAAPSS